MRPKSNSQANKGTCSSSEDTSTQLPHSIWQQGSKRQQALRANTVLQQSKAADLRAEDDCGRAARGPAQGRSTIHSTGPGTQPPQRGAGQPQGSRHSTAKSKQSESPEPNRRAAATGNISARASAPKEPACRSRARHTTSARRLRAAAQQGAKRNSTPEKL